MQVRVIARKDVVTEPLDVGPESKMYLADVVSNGQHGAPVTASVYEVFRGAPIDFDYDDACAVCYMLEGEVTLTENGESCSFRPGDIVYIPQKPGLIVYWGTDTYGKFFYVTYRHCP